MPSSNFLTIAKRILGIVVPFAVGAFLLWQIYSNWQQIAFQLRDTYPIFLIGAFLSDITVYPIWLFGWHLILRYLNQKIKFYQSFRIGITATFAKYIPGLVWQYLGRIELAKRAGVERSVGFTSLVYEVLLYLIAAILWSSLYFGKLAMLFALIGIIIAILSLPKLFLIARSRIKKFKNIPELRLTLGQSITIILIFLLDFLPTGFALYLILLGLGQPSNLGVLQLTSIYAFSWMVGYLTFLAPGGVGVADLALAGLLTPHLGIGLASLVAIVLRIMTFTDELTLGALVWKLWRKQK